MAHEIFGDRFVGMRTPAWHGLGTILQEQVTAAEALVIGGIDYLYYDAPSGYLRPDGTFEASSTDKAILRGPTATDPNYKLLGTASAGYTYLQNQELADGLDTIAEETGWKFETVGALGEGETIFITMDAGTRDVRGDEYKSFVLVADGKIAGKALTIAITPIRVVCQNTLSMAESKNDVKIRITHSAQIHQEYGFWLKQLGAIYAAQERTFEALDLMTRKNITALQAKTIFEKAYVIPEAPGKLKNFEAMMTQPNFDSDSIKEDYEKELHRYEVACNWNEKMRSSAFELYERFNTGQEQGGQMSRATLEATRETPYAALQAVTELVDWSGTGNSSAAIFGKGAKIKRLAFDAALAATR